MVSGVIVRANTFVYRNFQPVVGGASDGRLRAGVILFAPSNGDTVSERPKYLWVIHGTENWGAELQFVHDFDHPGYVEATAFGGPEWPLEDSVRTVIGVPDSAGFIRLLRCPDGVITKIE